MKKMFIALLLLSSSAMAQQLTYDAVTNFDTQETKVIRYWNVTNPKVIVNGTAYFTEGSSGVELCRMLGLQLSQVTDTHNFHKEFLAVFNGQSWTVQKFKEQPGVTGVQCGPARNASDYPPRAPGMTYDAVAPYDVTETAIWRYYDIQNPRIQTGGGAFFAIDGSGPAICDLFRQAFAQVNSSHNFHKEFLASFNGQGWSVQKYKEQSGVTGVRCGPVRVQ